MKIFVAVLATLIGFAGHSEEISFSSALSDMIEKNVDVQVQATRLRASDFQVWSAWSTFSPNLNLQAQQINSGSGGAAGQIITTPTAQNYSANATWNVFRSGSDWAGLRTARSDYQTQSANLEEAYITAENKAALALLDLIENKLLVDTYHRAENSAQHLLDIAELRFKRGLLSREEMDRVAIDASNAQATRADAEVRLNSSALNVDSLLGHHNVKLEWPWRKSVAIENVRKMLGEVRRADLELRPDWRAAEQSINTEDEHSRQLWRNMLPYVDLTFSQSSFQQPGRPQADGWSSMAQLTVPLWSGLHDYSAYRVQVESKYAAESRFLQVQRDAEGSVHTAQENFKLAYQQYLVRSKNLESAKHIMEQDEARFRMGRSDANELSLDLTRVTQAELLAVQGIHQVHQAFMDLYHAFGQRVPF